MEANFGKETYKYVEIQGGAPSKKISSPPAEDTKSCTSKEPEKSNEKATNFGTGTDLNRNQTSHQQVDANDKKPSDTVAEEEHKTVASREPSTPTTPNVQKESRKIIEVNDNERLKFVEVNARQEVPEDPPTKKGNRIVILRKRNREYKPLDNGDDLLEIKSEERVKLLSNYTVNPELFCEVLLFNRLSTTTVIPR